MNATRRRISKGGSPYSKLVNTDEESDHNNNSNNYDNHDINIPPVLFVHNPIRLNIPKSTICPKLIVIFSLTGIIFLSTIASLLLSNSLYLRVNDEYHNKKPQLLFGVIGAIFIYILFLFGGIIMWCYTCCEIDNSRQRPMIIQ